MRHEAVARFSITNRRGPFVGELDAWTITTIVGWLNEDPARLAGFRRGDAEMLSAVYTHYAPRLARAIAGGFTTGAHRVTVESPFELDDLVQETFIRAFAPRARAAFDGGRPFFPYLAAIARNLTIDRGRRTTRSPEQLHPTSQVAESSAGAGASPEADVMGLQLRQLYRTFVDELDSEARRLWHLRVEESRSRREVEEATGLSAMQVRTRETQLRRELVRRLDAAGYGPELDELGLTTLLSLVL